VAQAAYPTQIDLGAWLQDAGFSAETVANLDLATAATAGVSAFESATGRRMLATTQTREYDLSRHPNGFVDLRGDLASLTSVTVNGTTQVVGTDVRLREPNAADEGLPYWAIQLARRHFPVVSYPQPSWGVIAVTGLWGYGATIPDDAWIAMVMAGALTLFPAIAQLQVGGIESWTEQDVTERYGSDPLGSLRNNWSMILHGDEKLAGKPGGGGVIGRYRRVALGAGSGLL
jgi:hypothetical protein